jgi:thioesterase domain-containing protein
MAIDYNRTLLREEPQGPYVLCGLCSGGLVTLEMARRLQKVGHAPGAVILIDPPRRLIEGTSLRDKLRRAAFLRQCRRSIRHGGNPRTQDLVRRLRRQADFGHIAPTPQNEALVSAATKAVLDFELAVLWHRPRPYHGTVSVIHSRRRAGDRSRKCWRRHVRGNVHFFEAGAEHSDLFLQGNQAFAQQLRRCIDEGFHGGECGDELRQGL